MEKMKTKCLHCSGVPGSLLIKFSPAADGSAVFVSWSWTTGNYPSTQEEELRYYVIERTIVSGEGLWWQKLAKDLNSTSITGRLTTEPLGNLAVHIRTAKILHHINANLNL